MKITKSHLAKLIKEETSKISEMRYAENKETGRWEEVVDGAEPQAPRRGSAREDIEDAILRQRSGHRWRSLHCHRTTIHSYRKLIRKK